MKTYFIWRSGCFTCPTSKHATLKNPFSGNRDSLSPCMTVPRRVLAENRRAALKMLA